MATLHCRIVLRGARRCIDLEHVYLLKDVDTELIESSVR